MHLFDPEPPLDEARDAKQVSAAAESGETLAKPFKSAALIDAVRSLLSESAA